MYALLQDEPPPLAGTVDGTPRRVGSVFAGTDMESVRELFTGFMEPGSVRLEKRARSVGGFRLAPVFTGTPPQQGLQVFHVAAAPEMELKAVHVPDFYTICIREAGLHEVDVEGKPVDAPHSLSNPGQAFRSRFAHSRQVIVRIGRSSVDAALRARLGDTPGRMMRFDSSLRPDRPAVAAWLRLVASLGDRAVCGLLEHSPLAAAHFEQVLIHGLIDAQAHTLAPAHDPDRYASVLEDKALRRALEFCEEHAGDPISVVDIAAAAHTGVRTLQRAFRVELGVTPMDHLRGVRLKRVRAELLLLRGTAAPATVTDVALRWGFAHLGRFSRSYRAAYGESPSATLRG